MISVIIPVYNAGNRLLYQLECVRQQVYTDFEVLLVDDGSTDGSGAICDAMAARDARFRVIYQVNSGVSAARNHGMQLAEGSFLTFLDADDEIPADYLKVLADVQRQTNADVVVCDVVIVQDGKEMRRFTTEDSLLSQTDALNLLLTREKINSGPCAKLMRRSILSEIQFPPLKAYEDIIFVKDVFNHAKKIAATEKTEYTYIQNPDSAMHQFAKTPSTDIVLATKELVDFIQKKGGLLPECLYITLSHLFQYVQGIGAAQSDSARLFVKHTRALFRQQLVQILRCSAFPWKEKVLFCLFAMGVKR